jgi:hypothetical protein
MLTRTLLDIAAALISALPTVADFEQYGISQLLPANKVQDAIILCAKAVDLNLSQSIHSIGKMEQWTKLYTATENWQVCLGTGAQPILAINGVKAADSEDILTSFPLVIYTNRVDFYTSFLYHLSCLLLLQSRPHSLRRMKSACLKTIPWHSVQLCGISKSNRLAWSWDPIVVAALLYAGKFLSYCGQQSEMVQLLQDLSELTGWKTRKEIEKLKEFWNAGQ